MLGNSDKVVSGIVGWVGSVGSEADGKCDNVGNEGKGVIGVVSRASGRGKAGAPGGEQLGSCQILSIITR